MPGAIEAEHLSFKYTRTLVLEDVSFCIEEGDYVGLIGPNGGGKTTLLKLVLGLEKGAGKIKLFGVPLADFKECGQTSSSSAEPDGTLPQRTAAGFHEGMHARYQRRLRHAGL